MVFQHRLRSNTINKRRYDIDWLRVVATLAVFLFHCTRFFDTESWHLKNQEQSELLFTLTRSLVWPWAMELFFLLSGFSTWYFLKSKSAKLYLWDRVKRLLIPLYTVGLFLLLPLQFYFELLTNENYHGRFWQVIPRFFSGIGLPRMTPWPDSLFPFPFSGHLWFLQYLFLISMISIPLLLYLKSEQGSRWITRLAGWIENRGGIFIFVIPLALALICLRGLFETQRSWADFLWYTIFFVLGYIMPADIRFISAVKKYGWTCLVLWLVSFFGGIGILVLVVGYDPFPGHEPFSLIFVLYQIIWSVSSWSAVVFMLSTGAKYLNFNHKLLACSNEAVLPFYLLHQPIILAVGFFVIQWNMDILPKFVIITTISFPLILILYRLLVWPFKPIRLLFGMRS